MKRLQHTSEHSSITLATAGCRRGGGGGDGGAVGVSVAKDSELTSLRPTRTDTLGWKKELTSWRH